MTSLPSPASVLAIQIVQAAGKPSANINELQALCQNDASLVTRMLAYVNGEGFGLNRRVGSLQHALALLGIRGTRNLAITLGVVDMAPLNDAGASLLAVCLRRGVIARRIAEQLGRNNLDDYFALGLLLEVGLLVKARTDLAGAAQLARAPAQARPIMERAAGQEEHTKLASRIARSWQLGEEMANALLHHHDRGPRPAPLAAAAWLAEQLAGVFESNDATGSRVRAIQAAHQLELSGDAVDGILQGVPDAMSGAARHFGRDLGPLLPIDTLLRDTNEALDELNRNYAEAIQKLEALMREKDQLVAALKQADEKLSTLALTDELCGLPNHRAFREALVRDLARADRAQTPVALILLDLDRLAQVNDQHGQHAGDLVLCALSEILLHSVRTSDVPARIGGGKFALLLPNTNLQGAHVVAERARTRLAARSFTGPLGAFRVSASLGVAVTAGPGCRGREDALLRAAEAGLQAAKQNGRNRCMLGSLE